MYQPIGPDVPEVKPAYTGKGWFRGEPLATLWQRTLAFAIDYIPAYVVLWALHLFPWRFYPLDQPVWWKTVLAFLNNVGTVVAYPLSLYLAVFVTVCLAIYLDPDEIERTLGERIMHLRPVRPMIDPETMESFAAPVGPWRWQVRYLSHFTILMIPLGLLRIFFSNARQTFTDKALGVIVLGPQARHMVLDDRRGVRDNT